MADSFAPRVQPLISTGSISASRGAEPNRGYGMLFEGLADTMKNVSRANEAVQKTSIDLAAQDAVDTIANERVQNVSLPDVDVATKEVGRFKAAADQGKIPRSHYLTKLATVSKELRNKYPMYRDYVDGALSSAAGQSIGMKLADAMESEIDSQNAAVDQEIKFNRQYWKENEEYFARAAALGLIPEEDWSSGQYDMQKAGVVIGQLKYRDQKIGLRKSEIELEQAEGKLSEGKIEKAVDERIQNYRTSVYQAGVGSMKKFLNLQSEFASDGVFSPEEKNQIRQQVAILKREIQIGANKILDEYPGLSAEQRKRYRDETLEEVMAMEEFFNDPDFGVFNLEEKYNKDVLTGDEWQVNQKRPVVRYQTYIKKGFDKEVAMDLLQKDGMSLDAPDVAADLLLEDGTNIRDMATNLKNAGRSEKEIKTSVVNGIKRAADAILDQTTSLEDQDTAIANLYGSRDAVRLLEDMAREDPMALFQLLVNPKMTERLKGTKYFDAYANFGVKQFSVIARPLLGDLSKQDAGQFDIDFDESTGHFSLRVAEQQKGPRGIGQGSTAAAGALNRKLQQFNAYVDLMKPIIEEGPGGIPISDWVKNVLQGSQFNEEQGSVGYEKLLGSVSGDMMTGEVNAQDDTPDDPTSDTKAKGRSIIQYANQQATRNKKITPTLQRKLDMAVADVFGPGYTVEVFSGGQAGKGTSSRRTGSIRHDHGKAADVYIYDKQGRKLGPDQLDKLKEYWLQNNFGSVGTYMRGNGVHLDEWTKEALLPGMGQTWQY